MGAGRALAASGAVVCGVGSGAGPAGVSIAVAVLTAAVDGRRRHLVCALAVPQPPFFFAAQTAQRFSSFGGVGVGDESGDGPGGVSGTFGAVGTGGSQRSRSSRSCSCSLRMP
jgi:hypothetical protein